MKYDKLKATTKYLDMMGTVSFDFRDKHIEPFKKLFEEKGLDYEKYKVISYSFGIFEATFEPFNVANDKATLTAYAVSKEEVGETEKEIDEFASANDNTLPIEYFYIDLSFQDFFNFLKRFKIMFSRDDRDQYFRGSYSQDVKEEHFLD